MAVTSGLGLNGAMGTAVHMLDDVHGGAGQQLVEWLSELIGQERIEVMDIGAQINRYQAEVSQYIPGFGHRFHKPVDPRAPRLMALVAEAEAQGIVSGIYRRVALRIGETLAQMKGKAVPMNIDGATAVIYAELGFAPALARGLFCLSRSVGAMAHGFEQMQQGGRNKGPTPPHYRWKYTGK